MKPRAPPPPPPEPGPLEVAVVQRELVLCPECGGQRQTWTGEGHLGSSAPPPSLHSAAVDLLLRPHTVYIAPSRCNQTDLSGRDCHSISVVHVCLCHMTASLDHMVVTWCLDCSLRFESGFHLQQRVLSGGLTLWIRFDPGPGFSSAAWCLVW